MNYFGSYIDTVNDVLKKTSVTDRSKRSLTPEEGLQRWCKLTKVLQQSNRTMYFIGNGASAMMSSHMAADASKNGGFRSLALNDPALLTAISNDDCYEESFATPLKRFADPGDVLVTISSSGNSPNIIRALQTAEELDMPIVTLTGMQPDNQVKQLGNINFYTPGITYGFTEVSHQVILHCWLDCFMEANQHDSETPGLTADFV